MLQALNKNCIIQIEEQLSKRQIIEKMAEAFDQQGYLSDQKRFVQDVLAREEIFPTYIGFDIAIPHGKSKAVRESGICVAKLRYDVQWKKDRKERTSLVIMLAIAKGEEQDLHMEILAKMCCLLMHEDFRERIMTCSMETLYECLKEYLEV
ncbi:MAG: PTS sugar transporter subunit IIA [Lachnospiraceae bacterium]